PLWIALAVVATLCAAGTVAMVDAAAPQRAALAFLVAIAHTLVVGVCADRWRAALMAAALLASIGSLVGLTWVIATDVAAIAAVGLAISVIASGLAPQWALAVSGAFTMDGRVQAGDTLRRPEALDCLMEAGRTLTAAIASNCLLWSLFASALALTSATNRWATALFAVLLVIWMCRMVHFPLTVHRALILSAALIGIAAWSLAWITVRDPSPPWPGIGIMVFGALAMAGYRVQASALVAAVGRRCIRRLEVMAVLATVPILVGFFGAYDDLISAF
ncbi:MAG: hypothetical protein WBG57_07965, partial [Ornithinimicrobium sp.]